MQAVPVAFIAAGQIDFDSGFNEISSKLLGIYFRCTMYYEILACGRFTLHLF